ncbi:MAG: discoidin domain-containing protein [Phycisphaerae bacterium]|nr:discoidin domain-containing protein [Phycisphaerae bacterium]
MWSTGPTGAEWNLSFSEEDSTLYFAHASDLFSNDFDIWQVEVTPILDFNGDGKVDEKDFLALTQHWGQNDRWYDIGPMGWGDGVVDARDQIVFLETMEGRDFTLSPSPHATQVPRDAILTWTSPRFAQTYDVYFGTSFADVSSASRGDPRGVLVSQNLTATTYDPEGLLPFGRTYYWRIDEIGGVPDFTIYRGPVLDFKTEAYPIKSVIATASGSQANMGPEKTVDGSGLVGEQHGIGATTMWLSVGVLPNWIQYEFDKVYKLHELWVWNSNQPIESFLGFGAKKVTIEYSVDGTMWTALTDVPEFARAPGAAGYPPTTFVSFGGALAKYVKLTINSTWGGTSITGLSEVRFFYVPE